MKHTHARCLYCQHTLSNKRGCTLTKRPFSVSLNNGTCVAWVDARRVMPSSVKCDGRDCWNVTRIKAERSQTWKEGKRFRIIRWGTVAAGWEDTEGNRQGSWWKDRKKAGKRGGITKWQKIFKKKGGEVFLGEVCGWVVVNRRMPR